MVGHPEVGLQTVFEYIIPVLAFDGGAVAFFATAAISAAAGGIGLAALRFIGGLNRA